MQEVIIKSEQSKAFCRSFIDESALDGSVTVVFKKTQSDSTAKQRNLQWRWFSEVAASGLGSDDDKDSVHIRSKWQFARPILLRDDEYFQIIYGAFINTVAGSANYADCCRVFADQYIHTERMTRAQRAEYLSEFQRFWIGKGVELTSPEDQGKNLLQYSK